MQPAHCRLKPHPLKESCTDHRFESVAGRDARRGERRCVVQVVGRKRAEEDRGPQVSAAQHEQGEGEACCRPDDGDLFGHHGQIETQSRRGEVHSCGAEQLESERRLANAWRGGRLLGDGLFRFRHTCIPAERYRLYCKT